MKFLYEGNSLKSGIYKITNIINGRFYIGSAKEFKERWKNHMYSLNSNKHKNKFLQNDYNKCKQELGHDDFLEFHILEVTTNSSKEERLKLEEDYLSHFFDKQEFCYNLCNKAISREGFVNKNPELVNKKCSEAAKKSWSDPEQREKRLEKIRSKEVRNKISNSVKELWENGEYKETAQKIAEIVRSPEFIKKAKERFNDPEYKESHSEKLKEAWVNDDGSRRKAASEVGKRVRAERSKELTEAIIKAKAKHHGRIRSPEGIEYDVYNLEQFAKDHNVGVSMLSCILKEKVKNSRSGWSKV